MKVRLESLQGEEIWAKAGLMVREDLSTGSRHLFAGVTPTTGVNYYIVQGRRQAGADSVWPWGASRVSYPNAWLMVQRQGNIFTCYRSVDGYQWEMTWHEAFGFPDTVYVGIATTAHDYGLQSHRANATYRDLSIGNASLMASIEVGSHATEGLRDGVFRIVLSGAVAFPVPVICRIAGTAVNGVDYNWLSGVITVPPGQSSVAITVQPVNDRLVEGPETLDIFLQPAINYTRASPAPALVRIFDDENPVGCLRRQAYFDIPGASIADLISSGKYPTSPDLDDSITEFESGWLGPQDNYGQRLTGYLIPPETGQYIFYLASDDASQVFLSTDDQPTGKRLIVEEPQHNPSRNWEGQFAATPLLDGSGQPYLQRASGPISLRSGAPYYVEVLHKNGAGANFVALAWKTPTGSAPLNGSAPIPGNALAWAPVPLWIQPPILNANVLTIRWQGGGGLQSAPTLSGAWSDVSSNSPASVTVQPGATRFFRVVKP
jgi:regulation of enolase protein 1 (concanavalin A-like superfamily)